MIDGFRAEVKNIDRDSWLPKVNLVPEFLVNSNGEHVWKVSARGNHYRHEDCKYKGYDLRIVTTGRGQTLCISGSFHKSARGENHSQFDFGSLKTEIEDRLCSDLYLDPEMVYMQNVEIGLNLSWPTIPKLFLEKNLLTFKGEPFNQYDPDESGISIGKYLKRQQFTLKFYDKSLQYGIQNANILRFENRSTKMMDLSSYNIHSLQDLSNEDKVYPLINHLVKRIDGMVFTDSQIDLKKLPKDQAEIFKLGHSHHLLKNSRMSRFSRARLMQKFQNVIREYGIDYQSVLKDEYTKVWDSLFCNKLTTLQRRVPERACNKLTTLQGGPPLQQINHIATGDQTSNSDLDQRSSCNILTLKYRVNLLHPSKQEEDEKGEDPQILLEREGEKKEDAAGQKKCQVTQIPLTGKARNFLTEKMVRELKKNDPQTFQKLRRGFGQKKGQKPTSKKVADECYFIAHNIRNLYWNKVYQKQARKPAGNNPLF